MGIGLIVAAGALIWLLGVMGASMRRGEGALNVGRLGLVLVGVVVIGGASAIVAGVMPAAPRNAAGATLFLQSSLWWYTGAVALLAVIVGGVRLAWHHRAEEGRNILQGLTTLIVVAAFGVTATQMLIAVADSFSVWILRGALKCDVVQDANCFGQSVLLLVPLAQRSPGSGLTAILVIILGIVAILAAAMQVLMMVARSAMLVILAGILPLSAAATNTETGKAWFKRCVGWLIAFVLYKPAAAIVYAAAFQLVGTDFFASPDAIIAVLTGLMLMVLALFALPALMQFVTPLVGVVAGGAGGAAVAAGAMSALPMGAVQAGRLMGGSSGAAPSGSASASMPSGSASSSGSSGANGSPGPQGSAGSPGGTPPAGSSGSSAAGAAGTQGASGAAAGAAGGASGAASGAAAGGAAAGGATAAGAAAGPVGMAAGAAVDLGMRAGQAAVQAAQSMAQESTTTKEEGPSGSR
ncbi:hypothetical protein [Antribacter gilvus]|uniref:hypothetical protein n=1 Tax=Antribacter gilvus TaxID=2304675 RepID=UPI000F79684A|nr:hypothetical protein [Antribacter gilvus]